jgi:hypothetical protein
MKKRGKFKFLQMEKVEPPPGVRHKIGRAVELGIASTVAKLFYVAGLTLIIPFLPLILSPEDIFLKTIKIGSLATGAILVAGSVSVIFTMYSRTKNALISLGLFTFIPAIIATLYALMGQRMENMIKLAGPISPMIMRYIEVNVPTAFTVATVYFLLGLALLTSSLFWRREPKHSRH